MMKILCVTPNMTVDRTLRVAAFRPGGVFRTDSVHVTVGGKGINVARTIRRLGQEAVCCGLLAGNIGRIAADEAAAEGLPALWTWIAGETRITVIIVGDHGQTSVINEPGPSATVVDWDRFAADVAASAQDADAVAISGSIPPNHPRRAVDRLVRAVAGDDPERPVWVDTSGDALADAVDAAPFGIKVNKDEAAAYLGWPVRTVGDAVHAARTIRERGAATAVLTMGAEGAVMAGRSGDYYARPPHIMAVNAVGSGDCLLAALMAGSLEGLSEPEALRLGVAAGTANAMNADVGTIEPTILTWALAASQVSSVQ